MTAFSEQARATLKLLESCACGHTFRAHSEVGCMVVLKPEKYCPCKCAQDGDQFDHYQLTPEGAKELNP